MSTIESPKPWVRINAEPLQQLLAITHHVLVNKGSLSTRIKPLERYASAAESAQSHRATAVRTFVSVECRLLFAATVCY
jgi:hypothetical protein